MGGWVGYLVDAVGATGKDDPNHLVLAELWVGGWVGGWVGAVGCGFGWVWWVWWVGRWVGLGAVGGWVGGWVGGFFT